MSKGVSIIICCYNSEKRIADVLYALEQQNELNVLWEIILIDNNCSDSTVSVAKSSWKNAKIPLRIVAEEKPGLMHARMKGISVAQYEMISFIDDDNIVVPNWIRTVYELEKINSAIGAWGGQSVYSGTTTENWFKENQTDYAIGAQAKESGLLTTKDYLWGAGLCVRKSAIQFLIDQGVEFQLTGRSGKSLSGGEDGELCMALKIAGYQLYYSSELLLEHKIDSARITIENLLKMNYGFGCSWVILDLYQKRIHPESPFQINPARQEGSVKKQLILTNLQLLCSVTWLKRIRLRKRKAFLKGYLHTLVELQDEYSDIWKRIENIKTKK